MSASPPASGPSPAPPAPPPAASDGLLTRWVRGVGRATLGAYRSNRALFGLAMHTAGALVGLRFDGREVTRQVFLIGNRSVLFLTVTLGFMGVISVYQSGLQIQAVLPDFSTLGPAFLQLFTREFGPTVVGLMVATRVGSGIAAELGSMVVTEQIDALRMCDADPVDYLVAPRTLASAVAVPLLSVYAVAVAMVAGALAGQAAFGIPLHTFWDLSLVGYDDLAVGLAKATSYGVAIPILAAHAGFGTTGGSEGVGWATTRAVVNTSFAVITLDLVISSLDYALAS